MGLDQEPCLTCGVLGLSPEISVGLDCVDWGVNPVFNLSVWTWSSWMSVFGLGAISFQDGSLDDNDSRSRAELLTENGGQQEA